MTMESVVEENSISSFKKINSNYDINILSAPNVSVVKTAPNTQTQVVKELAHEILKKRKTV